MSTAFPLINLEIISLASVKVVDSSLMGQTRIGILTVCIQINCWKANLIQLGNILMNTN